MTQSTPMWPPPRFRSVWECPVDRSLTGRTGADPHVVLLGADAGSLECCGDGSGRVVDGLITAL